MSFSDSKQITSEERSEARRKVGNIVSWVVSLLVSACVGLLVVIVGWLVSVGAENDFAFQFSVVLGLGVALAGSLAVRRFLGWVWIGFFAELFRDV